MHFWELDIVNVSSIYMYFCKFVILLYLNLAGMTNETLMKQSLAKIRDR